jgi:hypothetical protein
MITAIEKARAVDECLLASWVKREEYSLCWGVFLMEENGQYFNVDITFKK